MRCVNSLCHCVKAPPTLSPLPSNTINIVATNTSPLLSKAERIILERPCVLHESIERRDDDLFIGRCIVGQIVVKDMVVDIFYVYCPWIITLAWLTWQALDPTWMTWETDRRWEDAWAKGWCWRKSESDYSLFSKQRNWPWFPRSFSCSYEEDCVAPVRTSLEWEVGGGFRLHAESSSVCRNLKKNKTTH